MSSTRFHRLHELFDAASELSPDSQQAFLEKACGADTELRRDVQSLLSVYRADDPLLETDLLGLPRGLLEGDSVGPYRVVREIGRGGMGIVYLAEDTRLNRQVALKALGPALRTSDKQQVRFRREAEVAASLSHPGIATIYALEEWDSIQYIVAEYVPGATLAEEFERGPLAPEAVLDIAIQLSDAVAAAHDKGVVHRDLKPHNVIRVVDGRLKIVDFGLAVTFGPDESGHARLTETGALLGTPAYMSPEQLRGEPTDSRSDLFALGIILCEGATGQHPFIGNTLAVTMAAILEDEPRGLEALRAASPWLESVVRRCLHKDSSQRFESAEELHAELQQLEEQGLRAAPRLAPARSDRRVSLGWWVFHQVAVVIFCSLLAAALWQVSDWAPGLVTRVTFIGGLAVATVIVVLRLHLLFTSSHNHMAIFRELSHVLPWVRRADWTFSSILAAAALEISGDHRLAAALLLAAAVGYAAVFLFVEPATRSAVFQDEAPKH